MEQDLLSAQRARLVKTIRDSLGSSESHSVAFVRRILHEKLYDSDIFEHTKIGTTSGDAAYEGFPHIASVGFILNTEHNDFTNLKSSFLTGINRLMNRSEAGLKSLIVDDVAILGIADGISKIEGDKTETGVYAAKSWILGIINNPPKAKLWSARMRDLAGDLLDGRGRLRALPVDDGMVAGALESALRSTWQEAFNYAPSQSEDERNNLFKSILRMEPLPAGEIEKAAVCLRALDIQIERSANSLTTNQNSEALIALTAVKTSLDQKAVRSIRTRVWLSFSFLLLIEVALAILTYKFTWNVMEPWTYFISLTVPLISYAYFAATNRELSPSAIYKQLIESKKRKFYHKFGFDLEMYERLRRQAGFVVYERELQQAHTITSEIPVSGSIVNRPERQLKGHTLIGNQKDVVEDAIEVNTNEVIYNETKRITTLSVSRAGKHLSCGGFAQQVSVLSLESSVRNEASTHKGIVRSVKFDPLQHAIASSADDGVIQLAYPDQKEFRVIGRHEGPVYCVEFHPDGKLIASVGKDSIANIWEIEKSPIQRSGSEPRSSGQPVQSFKHREGTLFAVDFNKAGNLLATCGAKGAAYIWNTRTRESSKLTGFKDTVFCIRFDPSGNLLAAGGADCLVRVWAIGTGECKVLTGHDDTVRWISFHPSGRLIASASKDRTIRLWELSTMQCWVMEGHTDYVYSVEFHPDGTCMYSASGDGTIRLWNVPPAALSLLP